MPHARKGAAFCRLVLVAGPLSAFAQAPSAVGIAPNAKPTLATYNLTCSDFKRNRDGSWSPRHTLQIGPSRVGPGAVLRAGASAGGIDLAAMLNSECTQEGGDGQH